MIILAALILPYFSLMLFPKMKKSALLLFCLLFSNVLLASNLLFIPSSGMEETERIMKNPFFTVHFYTDYKLIASTETAPRNNMVLLDRNPWEGPYSYYVVYFDHHTIKADYTEIIANRADVLHSGDHFMIVRSDESVYGQLPPAKNDGMIRIFEQEARLPGPLYLPVITRTEPDPFVQYLLDQVNGDFVTDRVQHLENYGTRDAYAPESVMAQQWITAQFLSWGLDVEVMDFTMPGGPSSDNVIATLTGTKYPDEYVVLGGHYDSISWSGLAPGADDNASGTSGVMEIARILSEYEFDRSIIFCAFSGEEYGLYGSAAYASRSAQEGMNILGYFNMDMIGYLKPGHTTIMTSLIYPPSAQELADFYTQVTAIYLPDFLVVPGTLTGGSSDHASFNNNGYMGIFPFEDVDNYSPYIHTPNDLVGLSYNHEEQAVIFTQAVLASVVTMANMLNPPRNLVAIPGNEQVQLQWDNMEDIDYFKVYRDGTNIADSYNNAFLDTGVENGIQYEYYVTAIYSDSGEESDPSNRVTVTPMPPISFPLFIDFENGAPYWDLDEPWGLTTQDSYSPIHSLTESPGGNYGNNRSDYATLHPLNLMGYSDATLSFKTRYRIENNWDFMYLQISTDGQQWTTLDTYTGNQNTWLEKTYSLLDYVNNPFVQIRFHFTSDHIINDEGMYIDDFAITVEGGYDTQLIHIPAGWSGLSSNVVPAQAQIQDIMQPVMHQMIAIKDMTDIFWPDQNINTLGSWENHGAFKIKMDNDATLEVFGFYEENRVLNFEEGWNLMPVLSNFAVNVSLMFQGVKEGLVLIKEIAGEKVYWPSQQIFDLDDFIPGRAYLVKASEPFSVAFPSCYSGESASKHSDEKISAPWSIVEPTASSHIIGIPNNVITGFELGGYIGVFTPEGLCAGSLHIDHFESNRAITVYANDSLHTDIDGFLAGQQLSYIYHESSTGNQYTLLATYDESYPETDHFAYEGVSMITSLQIDETGVIEPQPLTNVFPNPAGSHITIATPSSQSVMLEIHCMAGNIVSRQEVSGSKTLDISGFAKGIYFFHLTGTYFKEVHKVVLR